MSDSGRRTVEVLARALLRADGPTVTIEIPWPYWEGSPTTPDFGRGVLLFGIRDAAGTEEVLGEVIEVSGGVTLPRIAVIAAAGVDVISVGALTHTAPAADLGLDWGGP